MYEADFRSLSSNNNIKRRLKPKPKLRDKDKYNSRVHPSKEHHRDW